MARTAVLYGAAAVLVASAWLRLEEPGPRSEVLWLVALAALPALARPLWARWLAAAAAALVATRIALGVPLLDARPFDDERDFVGPVLSRFLRGFLEFYDVPQPFAPGEHPLMHGVLLLSIFGFCLAIALAIAARRPLLAGVVLLVASMWPATLVPGADLQRGALTLALVLVLLAAARDRSPRSLRPAAAAAGALVVASLAASASPAVAKPAFVDWKRWDLYDAPSDPVAVRYVWDASYDGIQFPKKKTVVLEIEAPRDSQYWRATTLDTFEGDRWVEDLRFHSSGEGELVLATDPMLPADAGEEAEWIRADVRVEALLDDRLVTGSMPVKFDPRDVGRVRYFSANVAKVVGGLERNDRYTVWSYAPKPTQKELARVRPPSFLRGTAESRYLELAPGVRPLPFGAPGREREVGALFESASSGPLLAPYRPLYDAARAVAGRATNQYAAVAALETWFRRSGEFAYTEQPPPPSGGRPPLVDFVVGAKAGYCQQFAGAMALMLRYLGIPARVAAGFTSGTWDANEERWTVTDHDAHAWVEVWFDGFGWLTFDPTPARGQLSAGYTAASANFDPFQAAEGLGGAGAAGTSGTRWQEFRQDQKRLGGGRDVPSDVRAAAAAGAASGGSLLRLLALVLAAASSALAVTKLALRKARYLTRDPRRLAGALRRELVDFAADQGVTVPRSATLADVGAILQHQLAVDTRPFVRAASVARFAPPDEARAAAREARRELRRLLARIRRRSGLARRLRGAVSLRSLAA